MDIIDLGNNIFSFIFLVELLFICIILYFLIKGLWTKKATVSFNFFIAICAVYAYMLYGYSEELKNAYEALESTIEYFPWYFMIDAENREPLFDAFFESSETVYSIVFSLFLLLFGGILLRYFYVFIVKAELKKSVLHTTSSEKNVHENISKIDVVPKNEVTILFRIFSHGIALFCALSFLVFSFAGIGFYDGGDIFLTGLLFVGSLTCFCFLLLQGIEDIFTQKRGGKYLLAQVIISVFAYFVLTYIYF